MSPIQNPDHVEPTAAELAAVEAAAVQPADNADLNQLASTPEPVEPIVPVEDDLKAAAAGEQSPVPGTIIGPAPTELAHPEPVVAEPSPEQAAAGQAEGERVDRFQALTPDIRSASNLLGDAASATFKGEVPAITPQQIADIRHTLALIEQDLPAAS